MTQSTRIDFRHLETFLVVAEELNFSRAAKRLGIAQPPLSRQIQRLEESLGAQLFDRSPPRIRLTEAGRVFVTEARKILSQVNQSAIATQRGQSRRTRSTDDWV
jgi:DNA-binding transcriptional LysR family regulator